MRRLEKKSVLAVLINVRIGLLRSLKALNPLGEKSAMKKTPLTR